MGLVKINQISPGMKLVEDLRDSRGRFLLPSGVGLTARDIRVLKMWGVVEADIQGIGTDGVEDAAAGEIDPSLMEMAEKVVARQFRHSDADHPAVRELLRLCILRKAEDMQRRKDEDVESGDLIEKGGDSDEIPRMNSDTIDFQGLIQSHILELPTLPMISLKMNETIARPNSSANDIARVISRDTTLSARLLKIVNSAFYGFPSRIDSVSRAVAIIGTKQLTTLASGVAIINIFRNIPSNIIDMKSFWKHSIRCGVHARIIASYHGVQNTERLFLSGLLHDIGRLILYKYAPDHAVYALKKAKQTQSLLRGIECEDLEFDHAETGGQLLKRWRLPVLVEDAVRSHHNPGESQNPLEPSIVHLADIMANAVGVGSSGECLVPPLEAGAWEEIGLPVNVLEVIMKQADRQTEEIFTFFYSDED